jgi:hypothetical protein
VSRYYDMQGKPVTLVEWAENGIEQIARDERDGILVSTVHLGLNHQYGDGPPLIFETMIFWPDGDDHDEYQERYSTREEALEGHKTAVALAFGDAA